MEVQREGWSQSEMRQQTEGNTSFPARPSFTELGPTLQVRQPVLLSHFCMSPVLSIILKFQMPSNSFSHKLN
jgi:hypothetical protein